MTRITVKLTSKELELLSSLASDQVFRKEFIDSRIPGNSLDLAELALSKHLIERLRRVSDRAKGIAPPRRPYAI
jgi:DNA-binding response OmpR family regulator